MNSLKLFSAAGSNLIWDISILDLSSDGCCRDAFCNLLSVTFIIILFKLVWSLRFEYIIMVDDIEAHD